MLDNQVEDVAARYEKSNIDAKSVLENYKTYAKDATSSPVAMRDGLIALQKQSEALKKADAVLKIRTDEYKDLASYEKILNPEETRQFEKGEKENQLRMKTREDITETQRQIAQEQKRIQEIQKQWDQNFMKDPSKSIEGKSDAVGGYAMKVAAENNLTPAQSVKLLRDMDGKFALKEEDYSNVAQVYLSSGASPTDCPKIAAKLKLLGYLK